MTADNDENGQAEQLKAFIRSEKRHLDEKAEIFQALVESLGEQAVDVILRVKGERTRRQWHGIAEQQAENGIDDLVRVLWKSAPPGFFEFTVEKHGEETHMRVTKCLFSHIATELGVNEWGFRLFCEDDPHIVEGFNPEMGFRRSKTLMEGHDCCDHCYWLK